MILLSLLGLYFNRRGKIENKSLYLKLLVATISFHLLQIPLGGLCLKLAVNHGLYMD